MKLTELKQQVDKLVDQNFGSLEVLDENRITFEEIFVDDKKGEDVAIISHGENRYNSGKHV